VESGKEFVTIKGRSQIKQDESFLWKLRKPFSNKEKKLSLVK
jgi:hypothetical protein